jgi:hypothetical protein
MSVAHLALFVVVESSRAGTERLSLSTLGSLSDAQSRPHCSASPQALTLNLNCILGLTSFLMCFFF